MIRAKNDFYVYVYFRPTGVPCYVGKGRGERWRIHLRRPCNPRLKRILAKAGGELPVVKIREGLTESEAFEIECALITAVGRGKNGPLVNMTDGGDGTVGYKRTADERARARAYWSSPEGQARKLVQSKSSKHRMSDPAKLKKLAERMRGNKFSAGREQPVEWRRMIGRRVAKSNRERETTALTRKKRSAAMKAQWADPQRRDRLMAGRMG